MSRRTKGTGFGVADMSNNQKVSRGKLNSVAEVLACGGLIVESPHTYQENAEKAGKPPSTISSL